MSEKPCFEHIRRTSFVRFSIKDEGRVSLLTLLSGSLKRIAGNTIVAFSAVTSESMSVGERELGLLVKLNTDSWEPVDSPELQGAHDILDAMAQCGVIVTDSSLEALAEIRRRDETLTAQQWNLDAAMFHFATRWRDVYLPMNFPEDPRELAAPTKDVKRETYERFLDSFGLPPSHFHKPENIIEVAPLPVPSARGGLYEVLAKRRTTRVFDIEQPVPIAKFSQLVYSVFGCHGYSVAFPPSCIGLKRTSPSGGGLHPTEAYVLIMNVESLNPGLYHYSVEDHSLELTKPLSLAAARELADVFTAGQKYPRWAGALFLLTARYYRNFWKYRGHNRAYSVLQMDVAHLSQTFYLLCAELSLGGFLTAAINNCNVEEALGLDPIIEGSIAILGCGVPLGSDVLDPTFLPYKPGETII